MIEVPQIPTLDRLGLYMSLGLVSLMDPTTNDLMRERSERAHVEDEHDSPHSRPWFTSFHACLTGDTEVVTRQGLKKLRELVGQAELLIPAKTMREGQSREGRQQRKRAFRRGSFQTVPVASYGEAEIYDVHLRRGRQTKTVSTNANHRWYLKDTSVLTTCELVPGLKLKGLKARLPATICIVPFAVSQGFVFGDGTARTYRRDVAWLDLYHNGKDEAMLKFFSNHKIRDFHREGRLRVSQVQGLPRTWKQTPDFDESSAFLLSWLAGYFAADGSVSKEGQATLTSASRSAIDCARGILSICGVGYGQVNVNTQSGIYPHGASYEDKTMYSLNITVRELPEWFFVLPKHYERAQSRINKPVGHIHEWEVVSVANTGRLEEVFCPTTPSDCFALSDELMTGNSQFPGDPLEACLRKLVYRMMNIPSAEGAMPPWVTTTAVMGKAGELDIADAWYQGGRLLAVPEDPEIVIQKLRLIIDALQRGDFDAAREIHDDLHQVSFVDREHWFTGSVDLPILPPGWHKPHIVEIKGKADDVLVEMINGRQMMRNGQVIIEPRGPDEAHGRQLLASLGLAHEHDWGWVTVCPNCWFIVESDMYERLGLDGGLHPLSDSLGYCPRCRNYSINERFQLEQPTTGEIYYWSRSWPQGNPRLGQRTKSFYYDYDPAYMEAGREILKEARQHFEKGTVPPRHPSMQWSSGPCQRCPSKRYCKLDEGIEEGRRKTTMEKITTLAESNGVGYAKSIRSHYSFEETRDRVLTEWNNREEK